MRSLMKSLSPPGRVILFIAVVGVASSCGAVPFGLSATTPASVPQVQTRTFYMGFNPWPYDLTADALSWTYKTINAMGDIVDHHLEEGVPWPEAYSGSPFSDDFMNNIRQRLSNTRPSQAILLSINPLSGSRDGIALYRGSAPNMPLPPPWNAYQLDDIHVKTAYLNYAKRLVDLFHPVFVVMGVEANLLMANRPALWPHYLELHKYIYAKLKMSYPAIKFTVSMTAPDLLAGYTPADHAAQMRALKDLSPYIDFLGVSLHPFMSSYLAETVPADMFDKIYALTNLKIGITESSYPAKIWSMPIGGGTAVFNGSSAKQNDFVTGMLATANQKGSLFVIYFAPRDYEALWRKSGQSTAMLPWMTTGLYDDSGHERPALATWKMYFNSTRK